MTKQDFILLQDTNDLELISITAFSKPFHMFWYRKLNILCFSPYSCPGK